MMEAVWQYGRVMSTEHGCPARGALLDVHWNTRREDAYDEACRRH